MKDIQCQVRHQDSFPLHCLLQLTPSKANDPHNNRGILLSASFGVPRTILDHWSCFPGPLLESQFNEDVKESVLEYCFKYFHIFRSEGNLDRLGIENDKIWRVGPAMPEFGEDKFNDNVSQKAVMVLGKTSC